MTFTVTYRGRDGALREECIEAADRAGCVAECRKRGISPTGIRDGSKGRDKRGPSRIGAGDSKRTTARCVVAAVLAVVLTVGGVWWWYGGRGATAPAEKPAKPKVEKPKAAKPQPVRRPAVTNALPVQSKTAETNATVQVGKNVRMERGVEVVAETVRTNQSGAVIEKLTLADGQVIEKVHPPKPLFSNPSDQMIAMALSFKPGQTMAPLPSLSSIEDDFARSLLEPINIEDGDSEDVKALKLAVKETRAYLAAEVKNGRSVSECLNEHREQMEKIADSHQMAVQQLQKLKAEGVDAEEIRQFRQRVNEVFRAKGIPELPEQSNKEKKEGR